MAGSAYFVESTQFLKFNNSCSKCTYYVKSTPPRAFYISSQYFTDKLQICMKNYHVEKKKKKKTFLSNLQHL